MNIFHIIVTDMVIMPKTINMEHLFIEYKKKSQGRRKRVTKTGETKQIGKGHT